MLSYRHAFHAGSHADVLKHAVIVHALRHAVAESALVPRHPHRPDGHDEEGTSRIVRYFLPGKRRRLVA